MTTEDAPKIQMIRWWLTSIAASVLCCSILFVLFASYLVDVKTSIRDNNTRLDMIEHGQDRLLAEIELLHKHAVMQPGTTSVVTPTAPVAVAPSEAVAPVPAASTDNPESPPTPVPATSVTTPPAVSVPTMTPDATPSASVPVPSDKK